jgi:hypothetical protein
MAILVKCLSTQPLHRNTLALVILVDDLGLVLADQDIIEREPERRVELVRGGDVECSAGPHLDHRAVDGDELDFVVVTGKRRRRAADQNRKHDSAYQRPHLNTANQTIHAEIIRAKS